MRASRSRLRHSARFTGERLESLVEGLRLAGPPDIPSTYVLLEHDEVLLPAYQLEHAKRIGAGEIVRLAAGHSAFASRPEALAELLLRYA